MPTAQATMDNWARRHYRHIEVRPITGALGAEIGDVDIARFLESEVVSEIRQALLDPRPLIITVVKLEHERVNFGGVWFLVCATDGQQLILFLRPSAIDLDSRLLARIGFISKPYRGILPN